MEKLLLFSLTQKISHRSRREVDSDEKGEAFGRMAGYLAGVGARDRPSGSRIKGDSDKELSEIISIVECD